VLVLTIWVLAALALFAAFFATAVDRLNHNALQLQAKNDQRLAAIATEATVIYLAATRPVTYAGIRTAPFDIDVAEYDPFDTDVFLVTGNELRLDGRWYPGVDDMAFSIQDEMSLLSLRTINRPRLDRLLEHFGVDRARRGTMIAALIDYIDRDQFVSLDGAEATQYRDLGLAPPTDRFLVSPTQLANVANWTIPEDIFGTLLREVTHAPGNEENYNFMTRTGMGTLDAIDDATIDVIIRTREKTPFRSLRDVNDAVGTILPTDEMQVSRLPGPFLRIATRSGGGAPGSRQEQWIGIILTPESNLAPWQVNYRVTVVDPTFPQDGSSNDYASVAEQNPAAALFQ
jgi:general secretion pathway protein K